MRIFLKVQAKSFQKVRKWLLDECSFVASDVEYLASMELLFVDIYIFQAISGAEMYCQFF